MNTDLYTPPSLPSVAAKNFNSRSALVSVLRWLQWSILSMAVLIIYTFAYLNDPNKNHWKLDIVGVTALAILLPVSFFFGVFLFKKLSNPWLSVLVYGLGLLTVFWLISCGFFAVLSGDYTVAIVGVIALMMHCPLINRKPRPPAADH